MHKLRTIDVWDTLIRRTVHPETIKLATARFVFVSHYSVLRSDSKSHWDLYHERLQAEQAVAKAAKSAGWDDEYELTDVLRLWLQQVLAGSVSEETITSVAEFELMQEIASSYADPNIRDFVSQYPAEQTIFLSDFYMSADYLARLITHVGLHDLVPTGIVSCQYRLNKKSGRLFKKVHEDFSILPSEHVHIGDNEWSDVEMPASFGISVAHFEPQEQHNLRQAAGRLFPNRQALFHAASASISSTLDSELPKDSDAAAIMERLGVRAAPLFVGFALFIAEQAICRGVDRVLFLTREGEFFRRVYQEIFPDSLLAGRSLPPHDILAASRQATFLGSILQITPEDIGRMWALQGMQTAEGITKLLDISSPAITSAIADAGLNGDQIIQRPEKDSRILQLFKDPRFMEAVSSTVDQSRRAMVNYMSKAGINPKQRIAIVDIGWRGTILDNIARAAKDTEFTGLYLGLRNFVNPQPPNVLKLAYGPDERSDAKVREFFTTFEPLELLCNSPSGTAVKYTSDEGGQPAVVRAFDSDEDKTFEKYTRHFQSGVIKASKEWGHYIKSHAIASEEIKAYAENIWLEIAKMPPDELVRAYYNMPKIDTFALSSRTSTTQIPSLRDIFLVAFDKQRRSKVVHYVKSTQWSASIRGISGITPIHRLALLSLYWLAHRLKALMMWKRRMTKPRKW